MAQEAKQQKRILLIGLTGSGKSSVIHFGLGLGDPNMVGDSWRGVTLAFQSYQNQNFYVCDSAGLGESAKGSVSDAVTNLIRFLKTQKEGFHAVAIVVMKDRIKKELPKTLEFFNVIIRPEVPRLYIITKALDRDVPTFVAEMAKEGINIDPRQCLAVDLPQDPHPTDPDYDEEKQRAQRRRRLFAPKVPAFLLQYAAHEATPLYKDLSGLKKLFRMAVVWLASWIPLVKNWVRDAWRSITEGLSLSPEDAANLSVELHGELP